MKKIETEKEREKRQHRNNLIVGIILVVLIGLSTVGYAIMSQTNGDSAESVEYGNLDFVRNGDYWVTQINNKIYYFYNLPSEVKNVSSENIKLDSFYGRVVYYVNPNTAVSSLNYIFDGIVLRSQEACVEGISCLNSELPVKNCSDNVIIFDASKTETKIYRNENCVFLEGNSFEAVDKLTYGFFNIA